jgi:holo-[acyl-carrier protein] synthase
MAQDEPRLETMQHVGIDIIEIARIQRVISRWGESFLSRVYTEPELRLYRKRLPSLAARFAGKEAVAKALGARNNRIGWRDIEILTDASGQPSVYLHGNAQTQSNLLGLVNLAISLSHSREYAIALVVGETE